MTNTIWLIPVFPLLGAVINGLWKRTLSEKQIGYIGCGAVALSFLWSLDTFLSLLGQPVEARSFEVVLYRWMALGDFAVEIGFLIDPLSVLMLLVVTGVGFLIHVYSIGYMHGDPGFQRYFAFLNLFVFSMLLLVLANNFLLFFVGWEAVGLCSYLLIGFWYERKSAADAGKKAFIVNRIGDFGFLLGIFLIFKTFGTLRFQEVFTLAPQVLVGGTVATWITFLLLLGATGKSAQIPLYVWLPDAMEGPTPVSALIHAATMVTAGVYMIARTHVLYLLTPEIMTVVALIGVLTAFFAASIGLVQYDIKRVLAYSTISQLGYMFLATGIGAFQAAMFHLMTHAFFKALLFLGAGSVIHALSNEQDVRKMGGLKEHLPYTYWTFLVGAFALAGIFPFAGFFSKDEILWAALVDGNVLYWGLGIVTAFMTAFYIFRLFFLVFWGESRVEEDAAQHLHESPTVMIGPLGVLAIFSAGAGFLGIPFWSNLHGIRNFLAPVFPEPAEAAHHAVGTEIVLMLFSLVIALVAVWLAYRLYVEKPALAQKTRERFSGLYTLLLNKYYVDEVYERLVAEPCRRGAYWLWERLDVEQIDGLVNGAAEWIRWDSQKLRRLQTGFVRNYALSLFLGAVVVMTFLLFY